MKFVLGENFSGPLDLLLSLVEEKKLSLSEISLSQVTDQFLDYLDTLENRHPETIADFLVVGARLLFLKSRLLLPGEMALEEDDASSLAAQLRLYKAFQEASKKMETAWGAGERIGFHLESPRRSENFVPPPSLSIGQLQKSMWGLVRRLAPPKPLPETRIDGTISIHQKIQHIRNLLSQVQKTTFHDMISDKGNRTEIIVAMLAILELIKLRTLTVQQADLFGSIHISRA
jgi:segregation and condensation protein A